MMKAVDTVEWWCEEYTNPDFFQYEEDSIPPDHYKYVCCKVMVFGRVFQITTLQYFGNEADERTMQNAICAAYHNLRESIGEYFLNLPMKDM